MGAFCVELLVRRRLPGFSLARVLGFGDGTGSAFWALQVVWPQSLEKVKFPSQCSMLAGALYKSYMLGEIPSLKDRITIACQLWDLSQDVLVSVEPGTPHGFNAISQM